VHELDQQLNGAASEPRNARGEDEEGGIEFEISVDEFLTDTERMRTPVFAPAAAPAPTAAPPRRSPYDAVTQPAPPAPAEQGPAATPRFDREAPTLPPPAGEPARSSTSERLRPLRDETPTAPPAATQEASELELRMRAKLGSGDFRGALDAAEALLRLEPAHAEAVHCSAYCRDRIERALCGLRRGLEATPRIVMSSEQIRWLSLDHRTGFLLSLIDGHTTIEELVDISGMSRFDVIRTLSELIDSDVVRAD
jgi:hypothetical protein